MAELVDLEREPLAETIDKADRPSKAAFVIWRLILIVIFVAFVVLLAFRLWETKHSEQRASGIAPAFTFTTFDGKTVSLSELRGQGVVVNFWASWCDPCRQEAVLLEKTWQREKDKGIVFLGLDYLDQEPAAKQYVADYSVTYPSGPDLRSEATRRYGIKGVPETFFIDPNGRIVDMAIGPIINQAQLDQYLAKIRPQ